jgi:hypothetical protein
VREGAEEEDHRHDPDRRPQDEVIPRRTGCL